jgi:hypothetical protein
MNKVQLVLIVFKPNHLSITYILAYLLFLKKVMCRLVRMSMTRYIDHLSHACLLFKKKSIVQIDDKIVKVY